MNSYGAVQGAENVLLGKNLSNKGVIIRQNNNKLVIDLHITVTYGVNVSAVTDSIIHKVEFVLEQQTGIVVSAINVLSSLVIVSNLKIVVYLFLLLQIYGHFLYFQTFFEIFNIYLFL